MKLRVRDLFCGAGGAADGYRRAAELLGVELEIVGVDHHAQPHYPFEFERGDALEADLDGFDFVHASPPCQHFSNGAKRNGTTHRHPDLIEPTRARLREAGKPYVLENIVEAPLEAPVIVCGTALELGVDGYRLKRHRAFESNVKLGVPACGCARWSHLPVLDVTGGGDTAKPRLDGGGGRPRKGTASQVREIMQMPWATKTECNEAVPPAYTELLGLQIFAGLLQAAA